MEVNEGGTTNRYRVVAGADEWDRSDFACITLQSPLAVALLDHRVGDIVQVVAPVRTFTMTIVGVDYPDVAS